MVETTRDPSPAVADDGDTRLRELGYTPRLERGLTTMGSVILTLSDITPAGSLLVVGIAVVALAGTGSVIAYLAGAGLAIMVALCMARTRSARSRSQASTASWPVLGTRACSSPCRAYVVQVISSRREHRLGRRHAPRTRSNPPSRRT